MKKHADCIADTENGCAGYPSRFGACTEFCERLVISTMCICADPENCEEPIPGKCRRQAGLPGKRAVHPKGGD